MADPAAPDAAPAPSYTLYSSPFSLYSMMARHTIALGEETTKAAAPGASPPPPRIALRFVDHKAGENLREDYLTRVNPKGQVPAMVISQPPSPSPSPSPSDKDKEAGAGAEVLTESLDISRHLARNHYPALVPSPGSHPEVSRAVDDLLARIHAVGGLSFSTPGAPAPGLAVRNPCPAEKILEEGGEALSPAYRAALQLKVEYWNKSKSTAYTPDTLARARADLTSVFAEAAEHHGRAAAAAAAAAGDTTTATLPPPPRWIFGDAVGPTLLDAHLLPVVLRCVEAGNGDLAPAELRAWAASEAASSPSWRRAMRGRPTTYHPSMGPVRDMQDMMVL